jgi:uncharacterized membrane protein YkvA (DUF1232 family)
MKPRIKGGSKSQMRKVRKNFWSVLSKAPAKIYEDSVALYNYMCDRKVPWYRKSIVVGCLFYLVNPFDLVPDITPIIGFVDDAALISATVSWLRTEIEDY